MDERKLEWWIIKFCKVIAKYSEKRFLYELRSKDCSRINRLLNFAKLLKKVWRKVLWIIRLYIIRGSNLYFYGSFRRIFASCARGKKLCSINEYGDKIVVEVRTCKQFKPSFRIRRFDPVGEKKCLHPINQACGVKPVILTHFTRVGEKLN